MTRKISLAYLTVPGMDPLAQVKMASKAGYDYVSLRTIPMGQAGEPQVHLENDPGLFASIQVALKETSLQPLDIELVRVKEDLPRDYRGAFECAVKTRIYRRPFQRVDNGPWLCRRPLRKDL